MVRTQDQMFERGQEVLLRVDGMTCDHCRRAVEEKLQAQPGVERTSVDLKAGRALVSGHGMDQTRLCEALAEEGYSASPV